MCCRLMQVAYNFIHYRILVFFCCDTQDSIIYHNYDNVTNVNCLIDVFSNQVLAWSWYTISFTTPFCVYLYVINNINI